MELSAPEGGRVANGNSISFWCDLSDRKVLVFDRAAGEIRRPWWLVIDSVVYERSRDLLNSVYYVKYHLRGARLNLQDFRKVVDQKPAGVPDSKREPAALYAYVGLEAQGSYQIGAVCDALFDRIRNAFTSGHGEVRSICRKLKTDLIREHVLEDVPLDPYFEVLSHMEDALRVRENTSGAVIGDWSLAIQAAHDHVEISSFRTLEHRRIYAREFAVAEAAKFLKQHGYDIRLEPGLIALERRAERSLRRKIEKLITQLGAVQVVARIFGEISSLYDASLERYSLPWSEMM